MGEKSGKRGPDPEIEDPEKRKIPRTVKIRPEYWDEIDSFKSKYGFSYLNAAIEALIDEWKNLAEEANSEPNNDRKIVLYKKMAELQSEINNQLSTSEGKSEALPLFSIIVVRYSILVRAILPRIADADVAELKKLLDLESEPERHINIDLLTEIFGISANVQKFSTILFRSASNVNSGTLQSLSDLLEEIRDIESRIERKSLAP